MATIKQARALGWQHEFDLLDDEKSSRVHARQRAHRTALRRAANAITPAMPLTRSKSLQQLVGMTTIPLTRHAEVRLKGRGITMAQVLVVTEFATPQRSHGATRYAFDRKSRQHLEATMPPSQLRRLGRLDIVAVVADDGSLITAAHRTERLRRDTH